MEKFWLRVVWAPHQIHFQGKSISTEKDLADDTERKYKINSETLSTQQRTIRNN